MDKTSILQKQVIAFLLAGVFFFLHVGKVLHTHEAGIAAEETSGTSQVSNNADCSICDYHFSKDAGQQTFSIETSQPVFNSVEPSLLQSRIISSIGLNYPDRGPPALL
jgi:hypothetical protein